MAGANVSPEEVARFGALAARWWDPTGPMRPLHAMNPARVAWIDRLARGPDVPPGRLLDIGCGAGLAAEALAERGHDVLGIDAAGETVEAARAHAEGRGLALEYRATTAEALLELPERFPVVTALEVIEHVPDQPGFVAMLARLAAPGGVVVLSTLNRNPRSWLTAKLGAEYALRMLPVGTHDWRRFVTPPELGAMLRAAGLRVTASTGLGWSPLRGWRTGGDLGVNYLIAARR